MTQPPVPVLDGLPQQPCLDCNTIMALADRVYVVPAFERVGPSRRDLFPILIYVCPNCGLTRMYAAKHHMQDLGLAPPPARS